MEYSLTKLVEQLLVRHGTSIEAQNLLASTNVHTDAGSLFQRLFFSKSDRDIWEEVITMKDEVYRNVYGVSKCPFEQLTGVNWKEMFRAAVAPAGDELETPCKLITPWFSWITNSAEYARDRDSEFGSSLEQTLFISTFRFFGEYVKINDVLYQYGESRFFTDRQLVKRGGVHTRLVPSTFMIDWRLVETLQSQKEYHEVVRELYALYYITGHSAALHSLFMETCDSIRTRIKADSLMAGLTEKAYFGFDGYEINFIRMHKHMFELMCKENPSLSNKIHGLIGRIYKLTTQWDSVIQTYIRFIAIERVNRIMDFRSLLSKYETYVRVSMVSGGETTQASFGKLEDLVHKNSNHEAVIFSDISSSLEVVPYPTMTKFMFDLYTT